MFPNNDSAWKISHVPMFFWALSKICQIADSVKSSFFLDSSQQQQQQHPAAESKSFDFSPFRRAYRGPTSSQHGSPATRSVQSEMSPLRSFKTNNGLANGEKGRLFATPPAPRRRYLPSPKTSRPSWVQRHLRRPQTVNVDDSTLSGKPFIVIPKGRY